MLKIMWLFCDTVEATIHACMKLLCQTSTVSVVFFSANCSKLHIIGLHDSFCRSMWCISAAYVVMRCLSVCLCVCPSRSWIVSKRINIFELFSLPGSQAILVFTHQTGWRYSDEDAPPPNGTSNAGGVGRNRDFEPISDFCQLLTLQQARCCQHDRRWTMATVRQVDTYIAGRILRVCRYSTTKRHAR